MKMGRPYTLASNRRISFRRKRLSWPVIGNDRGEPRMRDLKTHGMIRVIEDREALIRAIIEGVPVTAVVQGSVAASNIRQTAIRKVANKVAEPLGYKAKSRGKILGVSLGNKLVKK